MKIRNLMLLSSSLTLLLFFFANAAVDYFSIKKIVTFYHTAADEVESRFNEQVDEITSDVIAPYSRKYFIMLVESIASRFSEELHGNNLNDYDKLKEGNYLKFATEEPFGQDREVHHIALYDTNGTLIVSTSDFSKKFRAKKEAAARLNRLMKLASSGIVVSKYFVVVDKETEKTQRMLFTAAPVPHTPFFCAVFVNIDTHLRPIREDLIAAYGK